MKLSINVTRFDYPGGPEVLRHRLKTLAETVDGAGIDTMWVGDHLIQADPFADDADPMLEAYTTLGFLAAATSLLRLGTMVSAATYRAPALLIKAVTTLDVLSGGRAWLGIGAGYQQREADAMGLFLPPVPERFARLEETLKLAAQMWAGDPAPFTGQFLQLGQPISTPRPISAPRPRILIGGTALRNNLAILAEHCAAVGSDPDDIEHTVTTAVVPDETASQLADRCLALADLGIDHVILIPRGRPWLISDADLLTDTAKIITR
jgi:alkanesulfonate monooxygenase SsuD/methylene tetrahydromethanopterin reductase-like flavin-dependent oxidoreductase (luciferase family)